MNETITLTFAKSVTADKQTAIQAALQAELTARASYATITVVEGTIKNGEFQIDYAASYAYSSDDAAYNGSDSTAISTQGKANDSTDTIARFVALRGDWLAESYRNAVRSVANVASYLDQGIHVPPAGTSIAKYLGDYAGAINAAFPNTN